MENGVKQMEAPSRIEGSTLLTSDWIESFASAANAGPTESRIAEVEPNYWEWIKAKKPDMNLSVAFVVTGFRDEMLHSALLRFEQGIIVQAHAATIDDVAQADLVLGGSAADWAELTRGSRSLSQNIMYRKLRLLRGDLHLFFRNIYFFVETIRAGLGADACV